MKFKLIFLSILVFAIFAACQTEENGSNESTTDSKQVVEVTAVDYAFAVPDTIPSGWVTFRMKNEGSETHYFQLNQLPEDHTYKEFQRTYIQPFDSLEQLLLANKIDTTEANRTAARIIPDWVANGLFKNFAGGVPNLAPGYTMQTTVEMEPGTYVMSCFRRSPNRNSHATQGMIRPLTVTEEGTGATPPKPDVTIRTLGHEVTTEGTLRAGKQTVAYHVDSSSAEMDNFYSSALLARIESDADVDELRQVNLIQNPLPVEFIGGLELVAPGKTAYTELNLKPGRYAWLMHGQQDTVRTFTIE